MEILQGGKKPKQTKPTKEERKELSMGLVKMKARLYCKMDDLGIGVFFIFVSSD